MSDAGLIDAYLEQLRVQRQLALHTLAAYRRDLQELQQLAAGQPLPSLQTAQFRRFVAQLHSRQQNPRSIARKLSSWRGFYRWLAETRQDDQNPLEAIRAPKKARRLPHVLSADDAVKLVSHSNPEQPDSLANQAMFELLYSSGLRVSELTALDWRPVSLPDYQSAGYLDFEQAEVHVTGKGNKQRIVPVGAPALKALAAWLEQRAGLTGCDPHALFLSARGRRITTRMVQQRLKQHAIDSGMPMHVHPHMLRHSFASHVLQSSGDLRAVQEMLGHSSLAATQVYTALDFQHLANIYDQAHPRAKK